MMCIFPFIGETNGKGSGCPETLTSPFRLPFPSSMAPPLSTKEGNFVIWIPTYNMQEWPADGFLSETCYNLFIQFLKSFLSRISGFW